MLFVILATLALVGMADFGAVLILGCIFVAMLYAGFDTRIFIPIAAIGLGLALIIGVALIASGNIPAVIRYRFIAFVNPWSNAMLLDNGQSTGITISAGPGYQIQQAICDHCRRRDRHRLGFGSPYFVPLAASDFIFAALVEELGAVTSIAVLAFFAILILRILRLAMIIPRGQVFERLLLTGIGVHFFAQVFIMVGGTLNLLPLTGITIPFMSQGGIALLTNLAEIGLVMGLAQRVEVRRVKLEGQIWRIGSLSTLLLLLLSTRIVYWQPLRGRSSACRARHPFLRSARSGCPQGDRITEEALEILDWGNASWESSELPQPVVQRTRELLQNISRGTDL